MAKMAPDDHRWKNLQPPTTTEEAQTRGRVGGIKSGETRRRKRDMAALAAQMVGQELSNSQAVAIKKLFPDLDENATMAAQMVAGQINAASKGSTHAFVALTELAEKDAARREVLERWKLDPLNLTKDCVEPYRLIHSAFDGNESELRDLIFKGGRGGAKSTFTAEIALETMMQDPLANVVYGRRFKTDLKDSVYTQFKNVVTAAGLTDEWSFTRSPLRATRLSTGTSCYFFGFDNAEQLKSFAPEVGYVKLLIFEEADEMLGNEQMDSAADTFLRANGVADVQQLRVKVFNPPPSKNNFMNETVAELKGDPSVKVFDFSFKNVPTEWLGQQFVDRAAWFEKNKPTYYANNYLGEVTGEGGELFANVAEKTITDEEAEAYEHVYAGLDFGFEHPMAYIRAAYNHETDTLTILDEHVQQHAQLEDFLRPIEKYKDDETICDSAEPDRIASMREMGWDAIAAVKRWGHGKGRAYSWDWLRSRVKIEVDPERTPHIAKELRTLEFEKLKGGGYSSRYPDLGEDATMALIYAMNRVIRDSDF